MTFGARGLSASFNRFLASEQSGSVLLIVCTLFSLTLTNSPFGANYLPFWHTQLFGLRLDQWINDGLMAVFFLLIGLELERELYIGELSNPRNTLLPIIAAIGGMLAPALIHFAFNAGTPEQSGFGIPMATDIAFALGALALLGRRIPSSLKVFVVAFAVIDDLGAILIIATFYSAKLALVYLVAAFAIWAFLLLLGLRFRVMALWPYLIGGAVMWACMLKSGVHATLAGVMLAFAIPFANKRAEGKQSPSHRLEHLLSRPVAFFILPVFALANTCIPLESDWMSYLNQANNLGILAGLTLGKPLGITLLCLIAVIAGFCSLPPGLGWNHVIGAGFLGGIGFTMSIFIANLAFPDAPATINASKIAILLASLIAGVVGVLWVRLSCSKRNGQAGTVPPSQ